MNIYNKLINNSLIFAVGNLGTKLIVLFLVPLYTYYLTTSEFGMVDLFTITISFLMPFITLSIADALLRFVMDKNYSKQEVLLNTLAITFLGNFILLLFYPLLIFLFPFDEYIIYFYILIFLQSIFITLSQYVRANGQIKLFAVSGIVNAITLLVCNVYFLVIINGGIEGYLVSLILSYTICIIFVFFVGNIKKDFKIKKLDADLLKEMLKYSIPLIPNALMWWVMSFSDRYIITYFLGLGANGLYAVATKIPSILNILNTIFFQAWQMSAIEEANSINKSKFYSNVFNLFSIIMLAATSLIIVHLKIILDILLSETYFEAWKYVPFLLLAAVFSSYAGFLGTNYIAAKKTSGVFKTSVIGAIVNIFLNLILVPKLGINGAAISTMMSFFIIWILRIIDTRKFVNIEIKKFNLILTLLIIFVQIALLFIETKSEYLTQIILFLFLLFVNIKQFKLLFTKLYNLFIKKV